MGHLWDALVQGYRVLGLETAAGGDTVFRYLGLARIIRPAAWLHADTRRDTRSLDPLAKRNSEARTRPLRPQVIRRLA
jgi:hypothetical protein